MGLVRRLLGFFLACSIPLQAVSLPIYIEDSHAGSFSFFAQQLNLEKAHTLVLLDAHSDASSISDSDHIREKIRAVVSKIDLKNKVTSLRNKGIIQPFNWIEPLMPTPFDKVIWIAGEELTEKEIQALQQEALTHLDWKNATHPRQSGSFKKRFQVTDWQRFRKDKIEQDWVLSIDLDYFTNTPTYQSQITKKWTHFIQQNHLKAVSIAISRPWLANDQEANDLLTEQLNQCLSVYNSKIQFEPFIKDQIDLSEKAKSYHQRGEQVPRFDIHKSTLALQQLILHNKERINVIYHSNTWEKLLKKWDVAHANSNLYFRSINPSTDGVWRLHTSDDGDLWIRYPLDEPILKVHWYLITPEKEVYDFLPTLNLGKNFTQDASSNIHYQKKKIAETQEIALGESLWKPFLKQGIGTIRIQAEIHTKTRKINTNTAIIKLSTKTGFLGALEEQFQTPYVFGIGLYSDGENSGGETLMGNDCANFLITAWRRNGIKIPWSNPKQLTKYLEKIQNKVTPERIKNGLIIHLNSHVCALWKDQGTLGKVDSEDLVIHHLSGFPEITKLGNLLKTRKYFQLYKVKPLVSNAPKILLGGDVCLFGKYKKWLPHHAHFFKEADLVVANLETSLIPHASLPKQRRRKRFEYIVNPTSAEDQLLSRFSLLSLANNHSSDAGQNGLIDTIKHLNSIGVKNLGAGTVKDACSVKIIKIKGFNIGFIGLNLIENKDTNNQIVIASFPKHKKIILENIRLAKLNQKVDYLIAMPHWGQEYTAKTSSRQRHIAKLLINNGVDCIVGSHSHHFQGIDYYKGCPITYSLGNLVFQPQNQKGFNERIMLQLEFDQLHSVLQVQ